MPRPARIPTIVAILQLILVFGVATAAPPVPILDRSRTGLPPPVTAPTEACQPQPGLESLFSYYFDAPQYFAALAWRIPRGSCAQCAVTSSLNIRSATIGLVWASLPCMAHLRLSVVAAGGDAACPAPDTTRVLCPAFEFTALSGAGSYEEYTIPFPAGCCVAQGAFVLIQFQDFDVCKRANGGSSGIIASQSASVACDQYVTIGNDAPGLVDWYSILGAVGNSLWIQLDADCCAPTPARSRSWGSIKTLYR